jgi:hypothetical protein
MISYTKCMLTCNMEGVAMDYRDALAEREVERVEIL